MNSSDSRLSRWSPAALAVLGILGSGAPARGQLTLTPTGTSRGFSPLVVFVDNIPTVAGSGPLGFALRTDGKVLVTTSTGTIRIYTNDVNNQGAPESIVPGRGQSNAQCIAQIQQGSTWRYFLSQDPLGQIIEIDKDGNDISANPKIVDLAGALCLIPYPPHVVNGHSGHLFASCESSSNVYEIDPDMKTITTFLTSVGASPDGIGFSEDGTVLYVSCWGDLAVKAFDVSNGNLIWTSPPTTPPSPVDGVAVGTGTLTGYVYTNCTNGEVFEFGVPWGPYAGAVNHIATGGSRGDFIAVDTNVWSGGLYPSLLLTQTDSVMRLDPPGGGWFGMPTSSLDPVLCTTCFPRMCEPGTFGVNPCPCSNPPIGPGRGCDNFGPNPAGGSGGAGLDASGSASLANDSLHFQVSDEVANASNVTVLWQGTTTLAAGAPSGAGIRCVGGTLKRIYKGNASGGAILFPSGAQPDVHTASANKGFPIAPPVTLYYYAAYRNSAAATPCGSAFLGFNASNASAVTWVP